jgi:glycosyltransferase involved in cell wall biosynthesis
MSRILYVVARESRFTEIDRQILRDAGHEVVDWSGRHPAKDAAAALAEVRRADLVVAWFAGYHATLPVTFAWLLRRPVLVITGGYDVAHVPEADYGMQRSWLPRTAARWALRRATRLMANSESGAREARAVAPRAEITVVHHGVPDLATRRSPEGARDGARTGALTVGIVDRRNLLRKGLRPFVAAAAELPETPFVVAGRFDEDAAVEELRALAGPNVELTGWISDEELGRRYAQARVYVQPSLHEGFGMSVAEAMLAGCVPVVSASGALPEVVGDTGVIVEDLSPPSLAAAIERAMTMDGEAARRRVLERFTLEQREAGLLGALP